MKELSSVLASILNSCTRNCLLSSVSDYRRIGLDGAETMKSRRSS